MKTEQLPIKLLRSSEHAGSMDVRVLVPCLFTEIRFQSAMEDERDKGTVGKETITCFMLLLQNS
jgi:hypothetical protein